MTAKEPLLIVLAREIGLPWKVDAHNLHVVTALIVAALLTIASLIAWRKLRKTEERLVPAAKLDVATGFEIVVEVIVRFMEGVLGPDARRYLPLIGTLFIYIFVCNLMGALPGFTPPTNNISTNAACAVCVFVYYNYLGIKKQGVLKYFKHMSGPVFWLMPLMLAVELVSHLVRPVSLSVRLFGNMTGDHMVLEMFSDLVPFGVPVIFMGLSVFIAFIQAFVFSLLSIIYISLATEVEGH